jgi:hypothetical protein
LQVFKLWGSHCKITETSWVKSEFSPNSFDIFFFFFLHKSDYYMHEKFLLVLKIAYFKLIMTEFLVSLPQDFAFVVVCLLQKF